MKIGTTGTSFITDYLIKAFINTDNKVIAVNSRSKLKGEALALKYQIEKVYTDFDMMLDDKDIDTIYIGLPNALHFKYTLKAIKKHKHVILEKPFCTKFSDAVTLFKEAEINHVYLFEAILNRHLPAIKSLKEDIKLIGDISMIKLNFTKRSSKYDEFLKGLNPNNFSKKMGGGALMDLNIYNIHLVLELFGIPKSVYYYPNMVNDIDVSGMAILDYDNKKAVLMAGKDSNAISGMEVMGEKGYLYIDQAPSIFNKYQINISNEMIEKTFSEEDPYYFEVTRFKQIIDLHDDVAYESLKKATLEAMGVLMELYKAA